MESDLGELLKNNKLKENQIIYLTYQLLKGIKYMHSANIIHRDLKPKNLLVNGNLDLKICDFGLAKPLVELINSKLYFTEYVCTRWYRPPEVLLSWKEHNKPLDMWSVGCIVAEMYLRKPLFKGNNSKYNYLFIN